jgi:tripartite-type tricarboxylate transporter receptor subunit TctC
MRKRRNFLMLGVLAALAALALPATSSAQGAYPNRPIKFIVPYSAGGLPDTVARIFGQRLGESLGQSVVVDNKPGANGVLAAQVLTSSPADGYTFMVTDGSMFSINPAIYRNLGYDYIRDFVPVSLAARAPLYLAVHPKTGVGTLQDFIALAKAKPGTLNYGSSGVGSTHHLTIESMKATLGLDLQHIPYKGTAQSVPALVNGEVNVTLSALPSLVGFVMSNQVKLLAITTAERSPHAPDVPPVADVIPGFNVAVAIGVLAAAGTPAAAVGRISADMDKIAKNPETVQALAKLGVEAVGSTAAVYGRVIEDENARFAKAIQAAGIKPE